MKKTVFTIRELSGPEHFNRSPNWIRRAIHLGLIQAERAGNSFVVHANERDRLKNNLPTISREDYFGGLGKTK